MATPAKQAVITIGRHVCVQYWNLSFFFFFFLVDEIYFEVNIYAFQKVLLIVSVIFGVFKTLVQNTIRLRIIMLFMKYYAFINMNFCYQNEGFLSRTFSA